VTLREKIVEEIREHGPIPFSRYMELCLYHPELGYYSRHAEQFGKAGDFYASSDVHAVFGRLLARQFEEMWRVSGSPAQIEVLELGPGRGLFAQDVLDWSQKKFPEFFAVLHYSLAERSPALRERLQSTLSRHFSAGKASLMSSEDLDATGKGTTSVAPSEPAFERVLGPEAPLIIFANEFFDALPVDILSPQGELHISEKDGRFIESWAPASAEALDFLDRYSVHPEAGDRIETCCIAQRCMSRLAAGEQRGFIVAIDYGYTRSEQLAGRHRDTLMTYRQHSASANPYEAPGEQDITAHVNFTALVAAAEEQGMQVQPLLTQSQFLMGIGEQNEFADAFEECRLPQERAKVALQLKHLVTPAGMGESFHVLVASKGVEAKAVAEVSGLSFGRSRM
jgi:SAM-dependent MidA family methyltransferase